ncbi:MAG: hypothetical protein ACRDQ5_00495 [Sciscionella sp.]
MDVAARPGASTGFHPPAAARSSSGEQWGALSAWSSGAPAWPDTQTGGWEPTWRPAPFAFELHCLGTGPRFDCGGEPITGAVCDRTAMVDEHARGGPRHWQGWPRCQECAARQGDAMRGRTER